MVKFTFADGQKICVFDGEKVTEYKSGYAERYRQSAESARRATEWKRSGEGAVFRGDATYKNSADAAFDCTISGVYPTESSDWVVYSFVINGTSGIYKKCLTDGKSPETHVINSNTLEIGGGMLDSVNNTLAVSLKRGYYNSDIAIFDLESGDYKSVTDGDTLDADPYICPDDCNIIYFTSRGAGRDAKGEFVEFSPSAICSDIRP